MIQIMDWVESIMTGDETDPIAVAELLDNEKLFNHLKCVQHRIDRREAELRADYEERAVLVGQIIAPHLARVENGQL